MTRSLFLSLLALTSTTACKPSVGQPAYLVTDNALLAVRGEPPEAKPGASVTYEFLLASPQGTVTGAEAWWDICQTPKPPAESNAVASACAGAPDAGAADVGETYTAPLPSKACQLFGPIAPPPTGGQPAVRPRDPDSTGGYYQPVQVWLPNLPGGALSGFALERIGCNLANAPSDIVQKYNSTYRANQDPAIEHTDLVDAAGGRVPLDDGLASVGAGSTLTIETTFATDSAEVFPYFDPVSATLVDRQESLSLSWFATAGKLEYDKTGIESGDSAISNANPWTAPIEAGTVYLWLVLRDSRGGTSFKSYQVQVTP